jgi:hypothetical protein
MTRDKATALLRMTLTSPDKIRYLKDVIDFHIERKGPWYLSNELRQYRILELKEELLRRSIIKSEEKQK